jgi:hypothetical protein
MALSFTVVINVRHQFGDTDQNIGVFAGRSANFSFGCPSVSSDQALLLFQSRGVGAEQVLEVNGVPVFGGIPETDVIRGVTGLASSSPVELQHNHSVSAVSLGWAGNVMLINQGVLRDADNVLRIASQGDDFIVDNAVILFKTRRNGPVVVRAVENDHP